MIGTFAGIDVATIFALHAQGLTLADQWEAVVDETVHRTGLTPFVVIADLEGSGIGPTSFELADDDYCDAIVEGAIRRLDACEQPHNHVATTESWQDMAARVAGRVKRMNSGTPREQALAEIGLVHQVDAYVAARALHHFGRFAEAGGQAAVDAARLIIAPVSYTEH